MLITLKATAKAYDKDVEIYQVQEELTGGEVNKLVAIIQKALNQLTCRRPPATANPK